MKDITELLNLPLVASSHGHEIDMMMYLVHILMAVLFIGWGTFFLVTLVKFNRRANPKANYYGVKSHVSTTLEIAVAVLEAVLLVGFSIPFWAKQVNAFPNRSDVVEIRVAAEQFAWNAHYPGADGIFGNTSNEFFDKQSNPMGIDPNDPNGKDDFTTINKIPLPIARPAIIHLSSKDVIHSFGVPEMRAKQDAIPGVSIPTWFTPTKTGEFEVVCSQLCGIGHYYMRGVLDVKTQEEYDQWVAEKAASAASEESGEYDDFWN